MTFKELNYIHKQFENQEPFLIYFKNGYCIVDYFYMYDICSHKYVEIKDAFYDYPKSSHSTLNELLEHIQNNIDFYESKGFLYLVDLYDQSVVEIIDIFEQKERTIRNDSETIL